MLASTLLAPLGVPLISPALPVVRDAFGITDARDPPEPGRTRTPGRRIARRWDVRRVSEIV
ncbi:hypothetical protein [Halalkalicoccus salilacus]|uniref:hypothetical protein n=1 Tax=Halalkalicoccus salilacus TaxID=3117459 RepID=UPI00300F1A82